jgi:hypothetical protein
MRALRVAGAVAVVASCSIYDSSLLVDASPDVVAPAEAGPDAVADPCNHAEPPARPAADDPSDAGDIEFVTSVLTVDFNVNGDAGVYGFDLDHTCTCPAPESCKPAANAPQHCDDPRGRDNAGGALIQTYSQLSSAFNANAINDSINKGRNSMLIRVRNYNGTQNDTSVAVDVFVSNGTVPLDDAGANPMPLHDGTDQWGVDPSSVIGTPPPYVAVNQDDAAYVASGVLVANVSFPFSIGSQYGTNFLRLDGAFLVGTVTKTQGGYALAGVLAGRWDTRNLLTGMQAAKDPFNAGQYLCGTNPTYLGFKAAICRAADISHVVGSDNTGAPCDALSTAVGFTTEPAQLGGILAAAPALTPCGATYSDQCGN